uniref:CC chemokine-1 n=1 Tax=Cyprinus carpio TaxID=7962 RepID=O93238_CYPCA|nr:CC chemokine-1 [Cyprinus carpio]
METRRILMRSLAVAVVIASVIWTTTAADTAVVYSCCTKVTTAEVTDPILNIRLQRESLPCVKAVIFKTKQGEFCSDPKLRWVKEKVKQFFKKTPAASSISD